MLGVGIVGGHGGKRDDVRHAGADLRDLYGAFKTDEERPEDRRPAEEEEEDETY